MFGSQSIEHPTNIAAFDHALRRNAFNWRREIEICGDGGSFRKLVSEFKYLISRKSRTFDFVSQIARGPALFVGEGNLSFSLCLAKHANISPLLITASTLEQRSELSSLAAKNAEALKRLGAEIRHGINAKQLARIFSNQKFESIVFQFPNCGSRDPVRGQNPNAALALTFLKNACAILRRNGKVLISTVDSPHYRGAFQFFEAAEKAGFNAPESFPFYPSNYKGYIHTNTNDDDSALSNHRKFCTWAFTRKTKSD